MLFIGDICLSVILIDSVYRTGKNYYLQVSLGECKHVVKKGVWVYYWWNGHFISIPFPSTPSSLCVCV